MAVLLSGARVVCAAPAEPARPSLTIPAAEARNGDVVATLRDVRVEGDLHGSLVVIGATTTVSGHVDGDVVLFGGRAVVARGGHVGGRLLAMGTTLTLEGGPGAVAGGVRSFATMEAAFLAELKTSPFLEHGKAPLLLALRLFVLAAWMVVGAALLFVKPRRLSGAVTALDGHLLLVTSIGLSVAVTALLLSALFFTFLPARAALALFLLVALLLLAAKVFGLVALFLALGRVVARRARRGSPFFGDPAALAVGLAVLGCVSLVPAAGTVVWIVASLAGIGLSLVSGFGRPAHATLG